MDVNEISQDSGPISYRLYNLLDLGNMRMRRIAGKGQRAIDRAVRAGDLVLSGQLDVVAVENAGYAFGKRMKGGSVTVFELFPSSNGKVRVSLKYAAPADIRYAVDEFARLRDRCGIGDYVMRGTEWWPAWPNMDFHASVVSAKFGGKWQLEENLDSHDAVTTVKAVVPTDTNSLDELEKRVNVDGGGYLGLFAGDVAFKLPDGTAVYNRRPPCALLIQDFDKFDEAQAVSFLSDATRRLRRPVLCVSAKGDKIESFGEYGKEPGVVIRTPVHSEIPHMAKYNSAKHLGILM